MQIRYDKTVVLMCECFLSDFPLFKQRKLLSYTVAGTAPASHRIPFYTADRNSAVSPKRGQRYLFFSEKKIIRKNIIVFSFFIKNNHTFAAVFGETIVFPAICLRGNPVRIRNSTRYCKHLKKRNILSTCHCRKAGRPYFSGEVRKPAKINLLDANFPGLGNGWRFWLNQQENLFF